MPMADFEFTYDESLEIFYAVRDRRNSIMKLLDDAFGMKKTLEAKESFDITLNILNKFQNAFDECKKLEKKTCSFELHPFKTCMRVFMEDC